MQRYFIGWNNRAAGYDARIVGYIYAKNKQQAAIDYFWWVHRNSYPHHSGRGKYWAIPAKNQHLLRVVIFNENGEIDKKSHLIRQADSIDEVKLDVTAEIQKIMPNKKYSVEIVMPDFGVHVDGLF
jgi:hypothetical protein